MSSPALLEPGIFGIFRPVLLLPEGIADRLTPAQLDAILAHELCHVRRRDNLASTIHMLVEAVFWFHPLVWWIGTRLVDERERACDEEVLRLGNDPQVYAESILEVCRFYLESPLVCVSGITGANLKKRIEGIMTDGIAKSLGLAGKLLLAAVAITAVVGPVAIGLLNAPPIHAQSPPSGNTQSRPAFEVASIKPGEAGSHGVSIVTTPSGRLDAKNSSLKALTQFAYNVRSFQVAGAPSWFDSDAYDIAAKTEGHASGDQFRLMLQSLLADRFNLKVHRDTRELPVYALLVGRNGSKLHPAEPGNGPMLTGGGRGQVTAERVPLPVFATFLSQRVGRTVLDRTGLQGAYDFTFTWVPDDRQPMPNPELPSQAASDSGPGPSVFTALQEQLGLKLEAAKGPVEIIVIDHAERTPTEN